jgi:nucleoside-diphosphate-sugar epimerase
MARVVITGGAGFLGSHLCAAFLGRGDEVVAVDNFLSGSPENIAHLHGDAGFSFIEADVIEQIPVEGHVDVVMHFASPASPNPGSEKGYLAHPLATLKVGSIGTHNALELARVNDARFMIASTSEVYGDPLVHPQSESYWGNVNPIGPRSVYDEAKRYAEAVTMSYHREFGTDIRILRIFNTYGPAMAPDDGRVVSNFICQAIEGKPITIYGDGSQTRSFCFVEDEVQGILALLDGPIIGPCNIGNDREFTMLELAQLVLEVTGSASELVFEPLPEDDPTQRCPDLTVARRELGWEPKVPLREGIERTVPHFRKVLGLDGGT